MAESKLVFYVGIQQLSGWRTGNALECQFPGSNLETGMNFFQFETRSTIPSVGYKIDRAVFEVT